MNKEQELFTITSEECAELIMAMSKITRFGHSPKADRLLKQEIADVACMVAVLMENGYITEEELHRCMENKLNKLKKWSQLIDEE